MLVPGAAVSSDDVVEIEVVVVVVVVVASVIALDNTMPAADVVAEGCGASDAGSDSAVTAVAVSVSSSARGTDVRLPSSATNIAAAVAGSVDAASVSEEAPAQHTVSWPFWKGAEQLMHMIGSNC